MLALIAGRGDLPGRVLRAAEGPVLVCALHDQTPDSVTAELVFRLETLGSFLLELGERGVTEVCFVGGIQRPSLDPAALDAETTPLVPILQGALEQGDDGALRAVIGLFERTGFAVRGAHEVAPDIVAAAGVPTARQPRGTHKDDARLGDQTLAQMGAADIGQACVIRKGQVIAQEGPEGTDALLAPLALFWPGQPELFDGDSLTTEGAAWLADLREGVLDAPALGAILFKYPKPDQERRADLPTIGIGTALLAAQAGFDGIVVKAEEVIVLDQARVIALLDAMGMFLWVRA